MGQVKTKWCQVDPQSRRSVDPVRSPGLSSWGYGHENDSARVEVKPDPLSVADGVFDRDMVRRKRSA